MCMNSVLSVAPPFISHDIRRKISNLCITMLMVTRSGFILHLGSDAAYVEHRSFATSFSCRESIVAMTRASGASSAALPAAFPAFVLVVLAVTGGALGQYAGYQEKVITHNTLAQYAEILLPQAGAAQQISCDQNMLIVVWKVAISGNAQA